MKEDEVFNPDTVTEKTGAGVDRRDFLKRLGGGITVFFTIGVPVARTQRRRQVRDYPEDFNAYLRIAEDGRVSCFTGKIEMGQGIITSLAQMLAEELEVPLSTVDMVMGDTALCPYDSGTFGSRSTKYFGPPLRQAAAEAKAVLIELAAERLGAVRRELSVKDGIVSDRAGNSITYGQLARGKRIERYLDEKAPLKIHPQYVVSGKPKLRTDALKKVTGEAQYAGDIRIPGMLYARILRPPAHGAKLKQVDDTGARNIEGIKLIKDGDLVAALHEFPDQAEKALKRMKAEYDDSDLAVDNQTIFEHLEKAAPPAEIVTEKGSLEEGMGDAVQSFESTFFNHYVAHAPMETHTALVHIGDDEVRVWASTQSPFRARDSVAETLGISSDRVHVITPFVGGGFGGKNQGQQIVEAARLAKLTGRPVQVAWSREEEFFYDSFRPAALIKARSGLDRMHRITYWDFDIYFAGTRSSEPIYHIPHYLVRSRGAWRGGVQTHPFNVGAWRGPGSNTNVFAMESQTDIMAQAAGIDPLSFRMINLTDARMKRVLEAAAELFGDSFSKSPSGKGYGIACTNYLGTVLATMAEVHVDKTTGKIRVDRVVCAQEMGEVINPQGAKLQIEGCITMGLGYCLTEEIAFSGGKIIDKNFNTYQIPRFSWLPKIETVLVDNPDMPPQGCGEPAITSMGAVIANAVNDAVGVRMFTLPMTPERILQAIR